MKKTAIETAKAPAPIGPYNQAILVNNTLYVSGQIALDASSGKLVTDGIAEETQQVMKNIEVILAAAGMGFRDVVKCTIFIKNMNDFAAINEVYGQYFSEMPPARETVEVARLPKNVNVEISCVAVV